MKEILREGLYQKQIEQLLQLCKDKFETDPTAFFVLIGIIKRIQDDFREREIVPTEDYNLLEEKLAPLLLAVWESSGTQRKSA